MPVASQSGWSAAIDGMRSLGHISDETVRTLVSPAEAVAALENAFGPAYDGFVAPLRQQIAAQDGVFLVMPCYSRITQKLGVKLVAVGRHPQAESTVRATYLLLDPATAEPQLGLAANWLTDLRTAATSFIATKLLGRTDAHVLGIFGTGRQARAHIEVFTALRQFQSVLVSGSAPERARNFVEQLRSECGITAHTVDANTCASQSEIICACTTSRQPLFAGNLLRPGTHLNLVGAFQPDSREVDSAAIRRARVVVDTYAGALSEAGDLLIPLTEGVIAREHVLAELHEIVVGVKSARQSSEDITLFKSVGCALEDLALAELIAARLDSLATNQPAKLGRNP